VAYGERGRFASRRHAWLGLNQIVVEEDMTQLLAGILVAPLPTRDELENDDVRWPTGDNDQLHNPRLGNKGTLLEGQVDH
jgi:hypothetical protein